MDVKLNAPSNSLTRFSTREEFAMRSSLKLNKLVWRSLATQTNAQTICPYNKEAPNTPYARAKPYNEIPVVSKYYLIKGFLPGGEFYGKSLNDFYKGARSKYGDIFVFPAMFGREDHIMTFNPDDMAMIYRTEGKWPYRDGIDTLNYHRKVRHANFFGNYGGLAVE